MSCWSWPCSRFWSCSYQWFRRKILHKEAGVFSIDFGVEPARITTDDPGIGGQLEEFLKTSKQFPRMERLPHDPGALADIANKTIYLMLATGVTKGLTEPFKPGPGIYILLINLALVLAYAKFRSKEIAYALLSFAFIGTLYALYNKLYQNGGFVNTGLMLAFTVMAERLVHTIRVSETLKRLAEKDQDRQS